MARHGPRGNCTEWALPVLKLRTLGKRQGVLMILHIILSIGAFSTGALALIFLFATSLNELPREGDESPEAIERKAYIRRQYRISALFGIISALFGLALILTW